MDRRSRFHVPITALVSGLLVSLAALPAAAGDAMVGKDHTQMQMSTDGDQTAMMNRMPAHIGMDAENMDTHVVKPGEHYRRSLHDYAMPAVILRDQHGAKVAFDKLMTFDGPVLLNFIFTSCATICPVMSATFAQTQDQIAAIDPHYLMVSVSIDPDYDTPHRLAEYARAHEARDNWEMLTGQFDDIFKVVRAFDAVYRGENKMYHRPLTFLRAGPDAKWLRIEGLLGASELAREFAALKSGSAVN